MNQTQQTFKRITMKSILIIFFTIFSLTTFSQVVPFKPEKITVTVPDSIKVPYINVINANKAWEELKLRRRLAGLYQQDIHSVQVTSDFYKNAAKKCENANDTLIQITIPALEQKVKDNEKLYYDYKQAYKLDKAGKIGLSITLPVGIAAGFLLGWYLHR